LQITAEIRTLFRSLRHPNFRLFWYGQLILLTVTWMQTTAQAWLVMEITRSPLKLGVVTALQFAPVLILSLFTGPFIDRFPKRRIILACQTVLMLQALVLAVLVWTGAVRYWHVAVLATLLGIVNAADMPARQSFIIELVGRDDLMNAIGLNAAIFNGSRAAGPAVAGLLIGAAGTAPCFVLNSVSFLAVIAGLLRMTVDERPHPQQHAYHAVRDVLEGLRSIRQAPAMLATILLVAAVSIFGVNFNVLVPVFARDVLRLEAEGFGFLMSSFGTGALIGAITLTLLSRSGPRIEYLLGSGMGLSLFLVLLGLQHSPVLTALCLAAAGWCVVTFFGVANTTMQLNSEDHLRGRVMSIYTLSFAGLSPFGSVFAGSLSHWIQTPLTFMLSGLITGAVFTLALAGLRRQRNPAL
jgi:MFS family permease